MAGISSPLIIQLLLGLLVTGSIIPLLFRVREDYREFLSLGPGGTPSTIAGYLRIKLLGAFALRDPYEPPPNFDGLESATGYLNGLPKRRYHRPITKGIAPHRQATQRASPEMYAKLAAAIEDMAASSNSRFELGTSCFEKHGTGMFFTSVPRRQTCKGEICHAHPSDGSLHLTLHPADVKVVLEALWGERHPIARGGFFERFVPPGFVMVYAPQTEEDISIILQIIAAAAWFVCGEDEGENKVICGAAYGKELDPNPNHKLPSVCKDQWNAPHLATHDPLRMSHQAIDHVQIRSLQAKAA